MPHLPTDATSAQCQLSVTHTVQAAAFVAALLLAHAAGTAADVAKPAPESKRPDGPAIVDSHLIRFTAPPKRVPSQTMVDGPLLGNGDIGVVVAGPPEALQFFIGKNDFWGIQTQAPMAVGRIRLLTPALAGANYRAECDLRRAHWRGSFAQGANVLTARAWVDANASRFFIELANEGRQPLEVSLKTVKGAGSSSVLPSEVSAARKPPLVGCEQYGNRRWHFRGDLADLQVTDRAFSPAEIAALASSPRGEARSFDGRTAIPLTAPAPRKKLSITGWLRIADFDAREANYVVSAGEWNQAYSLGLSGGHLRFAIDGTMLQTEAVLPKDRWIHVAAVFEGGSQMAIYLDGKLAREIGSDDDAGLSFRYDPDAGKPGARTLGLAVRILHSDRSAFSLEPGARTAVVAAVLTDLEAKDPLAQAQQRVGGLTPELVRDSAAAHQAWWEGFWQKSLVEIPDKVIEQHWYSTQYIMASCSRPGKVAPGLWGNWITRDDTSWHGDFHLNYNFQAPYYSVYSANHPEISLPFYDAMSQSVPRGRRIAAARGWKGIHLPVSVGPWGMCPEGDDSDWGQRSNAAYAALNFIWYYQHTQDVAWLEAIGYPYLREVEKFWTDYLRLEDGRYVIHSDSIHEGSGPDFNPILSLGLVRTLYKNILTMSEDLRVDADLRPQWEGILARLSDYPTQQREGRTVFRYSERGMAWCDSNTLGIQHIFPAGAVGLDSPPPLLAICHNMIDALGRWTDANGSSSWYTACARIGYTPGKILSELRAMYDRHSMPNKLLYFGGGGIENASPSLAINEMLLQSHEGVIRFFPAWPKDANARFGTLRAVGAFLVSAELKDGTVTNALIQSEKGRPLTVQNPWTARSVRVARQGQPAELVAGERFTLRTAVDEVIRLRPE